MTTQALTQVLLLKQKTPFRASLVDSLQADGFDVSIAGSGQQAIEMLGEHAFDVLIADVEDTGDQITGLTVIREAVSVYRQILPIAVSTNSDVARVVEAMSAGSRDYLQEPFEPKDLCASIRRCLALRPTGEGIAESASDSKQTGMGNIIGKSSVMQRVFDLVGTIARGSSTVLITGETGTGKELIAQAIHSLSDRRDEKIVCINCGAIPENLLESELFGHVKGAFTGAHQTRVGRFEQANGGTIFLDEIGNMSLSLQVKLLRVLQEREFERIGGLEKIKVDVRIIAATSANLKEMVARNEFRRDLYYRLNVIPVQMPALRERRTDIPALATYFVTKYCKSWGIETKAITQEAMKMLMNHNWPGNIRELENAIERSVAITGSRQSIEASDLPEEAQRAGSNLFLSEIYIPDEGINFNTEVSELERKLILESLRKTNGNKREAAELLQLKRTTLIEKLRRFSLIDEYEAASA
jgi:DNA-binding NtrC family response regulator